nr:immunoglobulin light chain junction region [Macaca mulatta]MOV84434.1 immunoglobulin light chain junction region [Macaca mulatta]MOV86175.1 immunoglobulin light chain junction region [Macaca mulatta]
CMPALEFPLTF